MVSSIEINNINTSNSPDTDFLATAQLSQARAVSTASNQSADFTLYTDEGDKVNLSMASQQLAGYVSAGSLRIDGDDIYAASLDAFSFEQIDDFSILIEGDLNREEQKDVQKALKTIHNLISDFMSGKPDQMGQYTHRLAGLDSLVGIEGNMAYEKTTIVAYEIQSRVSAATSMPAASEFTNTYTGECGSDLFDDRKEGLTDRLADEIRGFKHDRKNLLKAVDNLFEHYLKKMQKDDSKALKHHVLSDMHADLFSKIAARNRRM